MHQVSMRQQATVRVYGHQDAESGQQRDRGSTASADQWQGHTDNRQNARHHAHIDHDIDTECQ
jgi:hypothetical protein